MDVSVYRPLSLVQKFPFLAGFHSAQNSGLLPGVAQIPARDSGPGMMPVEWSLRTDWYLFWREENCSFDASIASSDCNHVCMVRPALVIYQAWRDTKDRFCGGGVGFGIESRKPPTRSAALTRGQHCEVAFDRVDGRYGRSGAQTAPSTRQSETTPTHPRNVAT